MEATPAGAVRNLTVLCLSLLLMYSGFSCSVSLTSSLNMDQGLGLFSLAAASLVHIPAALTLPPLVLRALGIKWSVVLGILLYVPYVAANFYPSWYTMLPGALLQGVASGPLWTAAVSHLGQQARVYCPADADATFFFFMGVLFSCMGLTHVVGHVVSLTVLDQRSQTGTPPAQRDGICGIHFCDADAIKDDVIVMPSVESVHLLSGIYLAFAVAGLLLAALFLDQVPLSEAGLQDDGAGLSSCLQLLVAPLRRLRLLRHWMLLPVTVLGGLNANFLSGDFTKAYVACSWGVRWIGLAMMPFGAVLCLASPALGFLTKVLDRAYIMAAGGALHLAALCLLWRWTPDYPHWVLYLIPAIWGITSYAFVVQIRTLHGVMFPEARAAAYSLHSGLEAVGFLLAYLMSPIFCTGLKLLLSAVLLVLSMAGYAAAEVTYRRDARLNKSWNPHSKEEAVALHST